MRSSEDPQRAPSRGRWLLALLLCLCACVSKTCSAPHPFVLTVSPENEASIFRAVGFYDAARRAAERGYQQQAVRLYEDAIDAYSLLATAYNNLAMLLFEMTHDLDHAFALLERGATAATTLGDNATLAATRNNMGFLIRSQHEHSIEYCLQAITYYDQALEVSPHFVDALYNKAAALTSLRQFGSAEPLLRRVLELEPNHTSAHMDMGAAYFERGEIDRAVFHEDKIIATTTVTSVKLGALHNKGIFLKAGDRLVEALRTHELAIALASDNAVALTDLVVARRTLCLWEDRGELIDRMLHAVMKQLTENGDSASALLPYDSTLLDLSDRERKRLAIAHARVHDQSATLDLLPPLPAVDTNDTLSPTRPLRIGYSTYDFRDHPMGHLTLGLLDAHDADRADVYCYSYGLNDGSEWRRRAEQQCNVFRDGRMLSDLEFAQQIARDEVDILVDLMAHTTGARLGITSLRPSRVVVNYLGYPGTMGSSFTDYVLADRFVVPPEAAASSMTEQVVYLPHAYQVNEYDLGIPACSADDHECVQTLRNAQGLPENAIVFCNLNTIDKMEPVSFGVWMNILHRVPTSVLWLLQPSRTHRDRIEATLRSEAQARGVDPARIVFATRTTKRQHLTRISAADVFLDSFVYNAHSTAADALWANVPIVSVWGNAFPSRVAASLIRNVMGSLALVPHSIKEYEDLAVQLAKEPVLLQRLRLELARHVLVAPLFDTRRTTHFIESAYEAMHDVHHRLRAISSPIAQRFQIVIVPSASDELTPAIDSDRLVREAIATGIACQERSEFAHAKSVYERVLRGVLQHSDAMHLLGLTLYQMGRLEDAATQLTRVVKAYPTVPLFWYNRAVVVAKLNHTDDAETDLQKALTLDPSYTDAFFKLTDMLHEDAAFEKTVAVYERFGTAVLSAASTPDTERQRGYLQWSFALTKVARVRDAIAVLETAFIAHPTFFRLGLNLAAILSSTGDHHAGDELQIRIADAEARHVFATRGHLFAKHPRTPGRPVIVFYCNEYGQSWWPSWGPSSLRKGLGGSEEAVVFMARELHRLGYWVEVYGDPPPEDTTDVPGTLPDDGVLWYPHYAYDPDDRGVDVFIAWRYHISLAVGRHSQRRFFWVHDVPSDDAKQSRLLDELVDGILCVSKFQASLFPPRLAPKLIVTSNALDPAYFVDTVGLASEQRRRQFVYGSSPSRGLFELLQAWPRIRATVSNATLRIFYGFTPAFMSWGRSHLHDFDNWKLAMDEMLQQPGVEYVGLVDHETLAHAYAAAGFYLYPTTFSETSCVSLMKAMANGAIPITSRFPISALSETTGDFDLGPRTSDMNPSAFETKAWIDAWIESVVNAVTHETEANNLRQRMVQFARSKYQWAPVASEWQARFNSLSV